MQSRQNFPRPDKSLMTYHKMFQIQVNIVIVIVFLGALGMSFVG